MNAPFPSTTEPASEALFERAVLSLPGGNTRSTLFVPPHPPYARRGRGYIVVDVDGHEVIDLQANMSALVHGHAHPVVLAAMVSAANEGCSVGLPTESEVDLASHLVGRIEALELVRFANSGTEAIMSALRLARAYTGRDAILRFDGCYHGAYDAVLPDGSPGVPSEYTATVVSVPYGDIEQFEVALRRNASRLAAVIIDLIPNRLGLVPAPVDFARAVGEMTRQHNVLLIVDEVISFRLEYGGFHTAFELDPDLIALGKVIGGGLPVGAFGGRRSIMEMFDPRRPDHLDHAGTFTANPVVMRAGLTALDLLTRSEIERINKLGDMLRGHLMELGFQVNGRGSLSRLMGLDATTVWWQLYRAGILIGRDGLMCVGTVMTERTIEQIVDRFTAIAHRSGRL